MFLLDTNVISELRKLRPHGAVLAWINSVDDSQLFLSAVTLGEIQAGIEITREQDSQKAKQIENWLEQIALTYNVLPMQTAEFQHWAKLMHRKSKILNEDAMIAATAQVNHLIVVTRNIKDFQMLDVQTLNPFENKDQN